VLVKQLLEVIALSRKRMTEGNLFWVITIKALQKQSRSYCWLAECSLYASKLSKPQHVVLQSVVCEAVPAIVIVTVYNDLCLGWRVGRDVFLCNLDDGNLPIVEFLEWVIEDCFETLAFCNRADQDSTAVEVDLRSVPLLSDLGRVSSAR
jgi:hypothetical protein